VLGVLYQYSCGESALDWAIWKGSATLVEILLAAGASFRPPNSYALVRDDSTKEASTPLIEIDHYDSRGFSPMHRAALKGDARGLKVAQKTMLQREEDRCLPRSYDFGV